MKKETVFVLSIVVLNSCVNQEIKSDSPSETATKEVALAKSSLEITDPVCGMVKDSTWTDYTVYKGDTVWFCAESEKRAFEGNPGKYEKNLRKH